MGNGNCCTNSKQKYKLEELIKQKNDYQKQIYNEHKPVKLIFSNFKMKNLPFTTSSIQVKVLDQSIKSTEIQDNKNPIWKPPLDPIEIQKIKDDNDLKQIVIQIKILGKKRKEVGYVNINLYDVAVGPKRHDFQINWLPSFDNDKNILSRIQFELEFSQKIQLIIKCSFIKCYLNTIMPKDSKFKFNLTLISEGFEKRLKDKEDTIFYYDQVKTTNGTDIEETSLIKKLTQHEEAQQQQQTMQQSFAEKEQQSQNQIIQNKFSVPEENEFSLVEINEPNINKPYQVQENKKNDIKKYNLPVKASSQPDKHGLTHEEIKKIREQAEERARITEERLKIQKQQQQQLQKEEGSQGGNPVVSNKQIQLIKWVNKWKNLDDMDTFAIMVLNSKDIKESSVKIEIYQLLEPEQLAENQYKSNLQLIGQGFIYLYKLFNQKMDKNVDSSQIQYQNSVNLDQSSSSSRQGNSSVMSKSVNTVFNNNFKINKAISEQGNDLHGPLNGPVQDGIINKPIKHIRQFWEKIWLNGEQKGKFGIEFIIKSSTTYLRQMPLRIRTENGIQRNAPNFYIKEEDQNSNSQLRKLNAISATLFSKVFEYQRNQQNTIILLEIEVYLQSLIEIINPKAKNPQLTKGQNATFIYNSTYEKLKGQEQLIEIANHLLNYADEIDESLREKYYQLLKMTLNRGEFDLPEMGFNQKDYGFLLVQNILGKNNNSNNNNVGSETFLEQGKNESSKKRSVSLNKELENNFELELKVKVSLKYYKLLIQCLAKALDKMNDLDRNIIFQQHEQNFVYSFLAQAYFRVHGFREIVLKLIQKDDDPPLIDWRGSDFKLVKQEKQINVNQHQHQHQQDKQLHGYFDWYNEFYIYIYSIKQALLKKGELI
ncbi:hypothetical protein PPERSA_05457 [Pseudocohnilembus persalinus]|uniref:C2 domain n=1 Tax=Pseudocohnilembus persalinus TaxID=266149 RepID=A0A0V0R820_PSEPJ|nr:hypothetical protein PPERSA_05457 [Pseudocohnilembus persalinus]|eukprot:KRX10637.1 hypothetical protein PPERSA_05457 [Pseudocohnilembus persalinus]